jgi:hypothetical protein
MTHDRIGEEGIFGGDDDVAHVGDHETTGDTGALYLGDDRLREVPDAEGIAQIVLAFPQPVLFRGVLAALLHAIHQVVASGEVLALAADDDHTHGIVVLGDLQGMIELGQQVFRLGIGVARAVMADAHDRAEHFVGDVCIGGCHCRCPWWRYASNST